MSNEEVIVNKRDRMLSLLNPELRQELIPAGFFLHFDPEFRTGMAAVHKHIEFFRATDMDFVKIQLELPFPQLKVEKPGDWAELPILDKSFFKDELEVVRGLLYSMSAEALIIVTLYSPFMVAGNMGGRAELTRDLVNAPEEARKGIEIAAQGILTFARECIRLGVDGFYHSTQGGEDRRFGNTETFVDHVKPFDLLVMRELAERCEFNILHICDYHRAQFGGYSDLSRFEDYPGHVVNCSLDGLTPSEISRKFRRPFMGGIERTGVIACGNANEVREETAKALAGRSERFILGADCTVPPDTPWENLRTAIDLAHSVRHGEWVDS